MKSKRMIAMLTLAMISGPRWGMAGEGHGHGCAVGAQGPMGETGPQGPQGLQGANGLNGIAGSVGATGSAGSAGAPGSNGLNGRDAETHTKVIGGADVRVLDYEHVAVHVFDDYNLRDGRNDAVGVRVGFKIGESYEQREMARMKQEMAAGQMMFYSELALRDSNAAELKAELARMDKTLAELKTVAHRPGVHQEYYYGEFSDKMRLYDKDGHLQ